MEVIKILLSRLSIIIGVCAVFVGMGLAGDGSMGSMSVVIGGGLFMALGVVFIILERN